MPWHLIESAPTDIVILTDKGTARYVDQGDEGSPVSKGWYLCQTDGTIPSCAEKGMAVSALQPTRWTHLPSGTPRNQEPADAVSPVAPATKPLTPSQVAALTCLKAGPADFATLFQAGATGSTTAWLFQRGLVTERHTAEGRRWDISRLGLAALTNGYAPVL